MTLSKLRGLKDELREGAGAVMSKQKQQREQSLKADIQFSNNIHDYQFNSMKIPAELEKEIADKGLSWRFINLPKIKKDGYHKSGWIPYQRDNKADKDSAAVRLFGNDPDGHIIRGDSILAVKPKAEADAYRALLDQRTKLLAGQAKSSAVARRLKEEFGSEIGDTTSISDISDEDDF
jgi:hypothetical protein